MQKNKSPSAQYSLKAPTSLTSFPTLLSLPTLCSSHIMPSPHIQVLLHSCAFVLDDLSTWNILPLIPITSIAPLLWVITFLIINYLHVCLSLQMGSHKSLVYKTLSKFLMNKCKETIWLLNGTTTIPLSPHTTWT